MIAQHGYDLLAGMNNVELVSVRKVQLANVNNVELVSMKKVQLASVKKVELVSMKKVQLASMNNVELASVKKVQIASMNNVELVSMKKVQLASMNNVELTSLKKVVTFSAYEINKLFDFSLPQAKSEREEASSQLAQLKLKHKNMEELLCTLRDAKGATKVVQWQKKMEEIRLEDLKLNRTITTLREKIKFLESLNKIQESSVVRLEEENVRMAKVCASGPMLKFTFHISSCLPLINFPCFETLMHLVSVFKARGLRI